MFSLDVHHTKRQTVSNPPYTQSEINAIVAALLKLRTNVLITAAIL